MEHIAGSWLKGPIEIGRNWYGIEITKFFFSSTERNWNKWKFEMDARSPITE